MHARQLTLAEQSLAKSVFGNSIDYAAVRVFDGKLLPFQPRGTGMSPDGNLYMYGCYCADYATESPHTRALFIHEMAHVWQFQNKILNPAAAAIELSLQHRFNYMAAYPYHLVHGMDLTHYNMEQQASIVEDYFLIRREGQTMHRGKCMNACGDAEKISLYEDTLKKFLENPSYARRMEFPRPPKKPRP